MFRFFKTHWRFLFVLVIVIFLSYLRSRNGIIQQDNYVGYASHLPDFSGISFFDSRLFPGLPVLIYLVNFSIHNLYISGYLITFLAFTGSYFLLYKLTGSNLSILPLVFPPVLLNLSSLIDSEMPFIFLTLLVIYLIKKKSVFAAFLILGISVWFRLAGIGMIFGIFIYFLLIKRLREFFLAVPYFLLPVALLLIYNSTLFGPGNIFYQISTYEKLLPGRINFGLTQLVVDIIRAFYWGWFRILASGLFYLVFYAWVWLAASRKKGLELWLLTGLFSFTLLVSSVPFLENLGRYMAPTVPVFWLTSFKEFKNARFLAFLLPISILSVLI